MSDLPPPPPRPPAGVPPQQPEWPLPSAAPAREGRSTAFFVAVFLGLLLLVSGGLNVLLLLLSLGSFAASGFGGAGIDADGALFEVVHVAGKGGAKTRVLRVPIVGAIAEAQSPVLGASGGTVSQVRRALKVAAESADIKGILLEIDSPGGGVTDSDEIYRMLRKFRSEHRSIRVVALFGDVAASGGYYIAAASEHIFARRSTITGSIGVIMSAWNFAEAAKKLGVDQVAIKSSHTPFKDLLSPTRPMRPDEQQLLEAIVEELYQQFVDVVDEGRPGLDRARVQVLANGAIYTASQALQHGLIDAIGDRDEAVAWFERELGGPVDVVEQRRRPGLRDLLFGAEAMAPPSLEQSAAVLLRGSSGPRFLYFWQGGR